ncbi:MAG: ORF6N domain-containing protein [Chloroflexota bacterium]|nr:ORF6N domain-containing protein [Chloroflexota bacterium]
MLDADLAALYGVPTKQLNQAVRRNSNRFPSDFMFRLTTDETANLMSQIVTSSSALHGGRRKLPLAFTEQGVAMLSSVLRSPRAIAVNILIMRAFVQMRRGLNETTELGHRVAGIERRLDGHGAVLKDVMDTLRALERPAPQKRREIGFRPKPRAYSRRF